MRKEDKNNNDNLYNGQDIERLRQHMRVAQALEWGVDIEGLSDEEWDKLYDDFDQNWKPVEEVMKMLPPDQPINIKEWSANDFRDYYKGMKEAFGTDAAWEILYAKILERAGEGDGSVALLDLP